MKLLISIRQFESYGGSQLVVLELIEWFSDRGWEVHLYTRVFGQPLGHHTRRLIDTGLLILHREEASIPELAEFDLVWVTQNFLPTRLVEATEEGRFRPPVLWSHMGSLEDTEIVYSPELEETIATKILVVSGRTSEKMVESGLPQDKMEIFDNPVPSRFVEADSGFRSSELRSILCVSNHPPEELTALAPLLKQRSIKFIRLGRGGDLEERVLPERLAEFDAVITIGKTTQYCLSLGIPVYSYDHFGGAGWLNESNFDHEAFHNFSGYSSGRRLTAQEITGELESGYSVARNWSRQTRGVHKQHYSLNRQLGELLESVNPEWGEAGRNRQMSTGT